MAINPLTGLEESEENKLPELSLSPDIEALKQDVPAAPVAPVDTAPDKLSASERLLKQYSELNSQRANALNDASDREFKAKVIDSLGQALSGMYAGATAMNTKQSVQAPKYSNIAIPDLTSQADRKYTPQMESILQQYKLLHDANQKQLNRESAEERTNRMAQAMMARTSVSDQNADLNRELRKDQQMDRDVQKVADNLGDPQQIVSMYNKLDDALGFKLDNAQIKDGNINVDGKKVDLPGANLPGLGRTSFYSGGARKLQSAMEGILNSVLLTRSGKAVTNAEMDRIKREFSQGKFNTEAELLGALKDYKKAVSDVLKNKEAGFKPEVVKEYESRGGTTSKEFSPQNQDNSELEKNAQKFAQQHNLPIDQARSIMKKRMGL